MTDVDNCTDVLVTNNELFTIWWWVGLFTCFFVALMVLERVLNVIVAITKWLHRIFSVEIQTTALTHTTTPTRIKNKRPPQPQEYIDEYVNEHNEYHELQPLNAVVVEKKEE